MIKGKRVYVDKTKTAVVRVCDLGIKITPEQARFTMLDLRSCAYHAGLVNQILPYKNQFNSIEVLRSDAASLEIIERKAVLKIPYFDEDVIRSLILKRIDCQNYMRLFLQDYCDLVARIELSHEIDKNYCVQVQILKDILHASKEPQKAARIISMGISLLLNNTSERLLAKNQLRSGARCSSANEFLRQLLRLLKEEVYIHKELKLDIEKITETALQVLVEDRKPMK